MLTHLVSSSRFSTKAATSKSFDVAVVGAGAIGCSIASFLLELDSSLSVAIVERDPSYKIASSVLSVGSIRQQFSVPVNVEISQFGVDFIKNLSSDRNGDVQFDQGGYLFLAGKSGEDQLRENVALQNRLGSEVNHLGGGEELKRCYPWLNTDDIVESSLGASGTEGWFDPYLLTHALKKKAIAKGATVINGNVVSIAKDAKAIGIADVEGTRQVETLRCGSVVCAAGCWSQNILASVSGVSAAAAREWLPVYPRKRNVFVIHCPDPLLVDPPVPLVVDTSGAYFRREGRPENGIFLAGGMEGVASEDLDCDGTAEELANPDHEFFMDHIWPALAFRAPAFENSKVKSSWSGFYDYNVFDQNALLGQVLPSVDNFLVATGFSGHGIQQSPAVGRGIAEKVLYGEYRSLDLEVLGASRVQEGREVKEKNIV